MKVIEGSFGEKTSTDKVPVPVVFETLTQKENLEDYRDAFCIAKSDEYIVISTNMAT